MTIDDIKAYIRAGKIPVVVDDIIHEGDLTRHDGRLVGYQLHHGWDMAKAFACDTSWGTFNLELMDFIHKQGYDPATLAKVLADIQIDDGHWDWLTKSIVHHTSEYRWFFLMADGEPQAACLTYHPKESAYDKAPIFYIEYVAAAPWNRVNPMQVRRFKGVGTRVIKHAIAHANAALMLRLGFSLHAIPRASDYYKQIGMQHHSMLDKAPLQYFEMAEDKTMQFMGVS